MVVIFEVFKEKFIDERIIQVNNGKKSNII